MARSPVVAGAVLGAAILLAGCASVVAGRGTGAPTAGFPSTGASASTPGVGSASPGFPSSSNSAPTSGAPLTRARAEAALLTGDDIGGGFTAAPDPSPASPLPCTPSDPGLPTQVPPATSARDVYANHDASAGIEESIYAYGDVTTARRALQVAKSGFDCTSGTLVATDGSHEAVELKPDQDAVSGLSVDDGLAWDLQTSAVEGAALIVRVGDVVVGFTFEAGTTVDTSELPDTDDILHTAIMKVKAA